jgi:hypothetical protein
MDKSVKYTFDLYVVGTDLISYTPESGLGYLGGILLKDSSNTCSKKIGCRVWQCIWRALAVRMTSDPHKIVHA